MQPIRRPPTYLHADMHVHLSVQLPVAFFLFFFFLAFFPSIYLFGKDAVPSFFPVRLLSLWLVGRVVSKSRSLSNDYDYDSMSPWLH